jgi:DUF4097 and DUF4098 domain-containing protein YvlB
VETRNRNVWIIVAVVGVVLCCCALAVVAGVAGWFVIWPVSSSGPILSGGERIEQSFEVGEAPRLQIDNFAGRVTVRAGERGEIRMIAVKQGPPGSDLDRVQVEISEQADGLLIRTRKPSTLSTARVQLEVTVPAGTQLDLHTGAGNTEVRGLRSDVKVDTGAGDVIIADLTGDLDAHTGAGSVTIDGVSGRIQADTGSGSVRIGSVTGDIDAHTGSGSMEVREVSGRARLDTGAGSVDYQGEPEGDCRFETGTGSITLRVPVDLNMEVDLETGSGTITVDWPVEGQVSKREVKGTIGRGDGGSIRAHTGTGSIHLVRR